MKKTLIALAGAATIALSAITAPTPAEARGGALAAGIIGGLAVGAIVGGAVASPYYYGPGPYYAAPYPYDAYGCWRRERVWDPGYGWIVRRVRVC